MVVSQQISPSALRAYKLSKYANGQPGKMLLEAKKAKRVTSQFMSKSGAKEAAKRMKALKRTAANTKKIADAATKVNDALLKKIPGGGGTVGKAGRVGAILAIFAAIGVVAVLKFQEFIVNRNFDDLFNTQLDLTKINTIAVNNGLKLKAFETKLQKYEQELSVNARDFYRLSKQTEIIAKNAVDAKKQGNDVLYETRQGRAILETKIADSKKQSNDALYEARTGREKLEVKIKDIQQQINKTASDANQKFQQQIQLTVDNIQKGLAEAKAQAKTATETNSVQSNLINTVQSAIKTLDTKFVDLKNSIVQIVNNKIQPLEVKQQQTEQKLGVTVTSIEGTVAGLNQTYQMTYDSQAAKWNADLSKLQSRVGEVESVTGSSNFTSTTANLTKEVNQIKQDIPKIQNDVAKIDTKLKEQEKVNQEALPKLDQIVGILGLIPARAAAAIRPDLPTVPQMEAAAATGTCRTLQPGGCMNKALNDNATNIASNNNINAANILDAVNTGANAAQLALLQTIDNKIGGQLPGGLSGTFGRLWQTLQVDRILNVLILITTFHNALMLSNNIAQTLFGAVDNISQAAGFKWKNEKGEEESFGEIVGDWTQSFFKTIFGTENYTNLVAAYKRANRIYQAGANIINATRSMVDSLRNITEYCAEGIGKVGNALKKAGTIASDAFNWMPENVDGRSIWIRRLENINEVAEGLEMVTGEVLGITQNINEIREQTDEFNRGIKDLPPKDRDNNEPVKSREDTATAASTSVIIPQTLERKPTS